MITTQHTPVGWRRGLVGAFVALLAIVTCGTAALAQIAVTVTIKDTSDPACTGGTGICPEPSVVGQQYAVEFEVRVTGSNPDSLSPYGTVTVTDGTGASDSRTVSSGSYPSGWVWRCFLTSTSAGTKTITASFVSSDGLFANGSDTESHTVTKASTTLLLSTAPDPSVIGETVTLTANVTATSPGSGSPTGTVSFTYGSGTVLGTAGLVSTGTATSQAVLTTEALPAGTHTITATYAGSVDYNGSSDTEGHTVSKRQTVTTVFVSDTPLVVNETATGTVVVEGVPTNYGAAPTGTVTLSHTGSGTLSPTTHTLTAAEGGQFEFTYTPTNAATTPHVITATYAGDSVYTTSSDTFSQAVEKRAADIRIVCDPGTAFIGQPVTCSIHVEDDSTAGTAGSLNGIELTLSDGGKAGMFSDDTPTLDASGNCTVTYTPGAWDAGTGTATTTISATIASSSVYESAGGAGSLSVKLRPTQTTVTGSSDTLLVNQGYAYQVVVEDTAGVGTVTSPLGILAYSSVLGADATLVPVLGAAPTGSFTYKCIGLNGDAGIDTVYAHYTSTDGIHANSGGGFGQGVQRRPTTMVVTGYSTPTGVTCTASVSEEVGLPGDETPLRGDITRYEALTAAPYFQDVTVCSGLGPALTISCDDFDVTSDSPVANVSVKYKPTDRVHLTSTGGVNVNRFDQYTEDPGDGTTGASCEDGCGSGGVDIQNMIYALNATETALKAVKWGLDIAALVIDVIPDGVITGGLVVQTGVTIPYSDIAAAIIEGVGIALDIAIEVMDTDLDDDGIPDVIEENTTHTNPFKVDSDGDGLGDLDEIDEAGGFYGGSRRPNPNNPDSDGDGLSDGDEAGLYNTSFCLADTDCDTVSDGVEVGTWALADPRDHADPLMQDTDGDGLTDDLEIASGCPRVNDADSDDDGLQDGHEDQNRDGTISNTIGTSTTQGSGETDFCLWDTDGDGLGDGEEEALFGTSVTPRGVSATVGVQGADLGSTVPALDTDIDNDGLTDYGEVNTYQTDPTDADTDNDTLSDGAEVATWTSPDARDHSNPREADTDGDGLVDPLEILLGCPFVNDADSDDDGLQDGHEDANRDGIIVNNLGSTGTQGSGETDFCNPDTDGDGLLDGEEEALFGQGPRTAITPTGLVTTVPALDDDSDDDGLSDYEEVNITRTDPLNWDTDGDNLSDLNELLATSGAWPARTFTQVSDPLDPDTDDDGLPDNVEYNGTGMGTSHGLGGSDDLICPYVNDADSDDDGLQDGVEDANHDGVWSGVVLGSHDSQAQRTGDYWETDPCNCDTDGDGLMDGEEVALLGGGPISARPADWPNAQPAPGFYTIIPESVSIVGPLGPNYDGGPLYTFTPMPGAKDVANATVPALDSDSDNDGLSDYEEVMITGTDPLDADTDNDTLADADELIATGGAWPRRSFDQESNPFDINTDDDYLFDPSEGSCGNATYSGTGLRALAPGLGGLRDVLCPYVNNADSDDDGVKDGAVIPIQRQGPGMVYSYVFFEAFLDVPGADVAAPGVVRVVVTPATGEQDDDPICNVCDPDSDGDGLTDGQEIGLGTDPQDWDTDDDGRNDWHEITGGGPIPTDPFDPDTDDDGLLDSAEVFGSNPTNPANCDTDADGLCDGGNRTPYMTSGHPTVTLNPRCVTGIGGHPNPLGIGENERGDGARHPDETDPNNPDTDGDAVGDGMERLSFSVSRQYLIPAVDLFGRPITVSYPEANNIRPVCGCLDPLNPDSDGDGLLDGEEDLNHDGHFDFLVSDFDHGDHAIPGPPIPHRMETNPCDPDSDHDGLTDWEELRGQPNAPQFFPFNPTNPLDHDTDNDWLTDGVEVFYVCSEILYTTLDNDVDGRIDEDPIDGLDNDGDGLIDEDPVDFEIRFVPVLDPTNRDSDSDGFIDGLDEDPCNSELLPYLYPIEGDLADSDGDGFSDIDELLAGTNEFDPESHPVAFAHVDLDFDECIDDRIWLEPILVCCPPPGLARSVVIDLDGNMLVDLRLTIVSRNATRGDFDMDGAEDDMRYVVDYLLGNYRALQSKVTATILDYNSDFVIDRVIVEKK